MARPWRLVRTGIHTAFENMAIDHVLLDACHSGTGTNTLRFYRWSPSAVSIGRFQHIQNEVNVDACKSQGIDVVRRLSSGGAVYHDFKGELTYSIICNIEEIKLPDDVIATYEHLCKGLLKGLRHLGVHADFSSGKEGFCPNLFIEGRKISGNAQSRRGNVLLQHGTILRQLDLRQMFSFLKIRGSIPSNEVIDQVSKRLTSLQHELDEVPSFEKIEEVLIAGFSDALPAHFYDEPLTSAELQRAQKIAETWYNTEEWTLQRGLKQ
ncbi:MAG: biotin/lipoate A/B protein ligase family protein [Promethearchaeota archaeon]